MTEQATPQCPVCEKRNHRTFSVKETRDDGAPEDDRTRTVRTLAECQNCGNVYNPRLAGRE